MLMEEKDGADQMTVTPIDPRELLKRWEAAKLPSVTPTQVRALLEDNYKAYGIPVHLMEPDGFEFDEEVREDLIDALFTITNPAVLLELRNGRPVTVDEDAVEDAEFYWQELFHGDMLEFPYRVLSAQHALGQRVSVLLEREGSFITGFKVYGVAGDKLNRYLTAVIGFPSRREQDPEDGPFMRAGDLTDPVFVDYLEATAESGLI